jgi:hypothetical protein
MTDQWYLSRDGQNYGPYSWSDLVEFSKTGKLNPQDLLWNQASNDWVKAKDIPGLFSDPTPTPATDSKKKLLLISLISVAIVVVGLLSFFLSRHYSGKMNLGGIARQTSQTANSSGQSASTNFGATSYKEPDPGLLINSSQWGRAPANQVCILLEDAKGKKDAQSIAEQLSGTLVGEMEYIQLYQIEINSTSAEQLEKAIEQAKGLPNVASAFPNKIITSKLTIEGKRCSPLNDPMYGGGNVRTYDMVGLQEAWDYIKASGVTLNTARVGVVDSAVYTRSGHDFSPELHLPDKAGKHPAGKVQVRVSKPADDLTDSLSKNDQGALKHGGLSHGTMVTHVIGADPGSGTAGIAGILGDKLQISVNNAFSGSDASQVQTPDPNDPTQYQGYSIKALVLMQEQIRDNVKVINLSLGPEKPEQSNSFINEAYRRFFARMQQDHPDVVFVAAAGNEKGALDGSNYGPGGLKLPNVITVGALDTEGKSASFTNHAAGNGEVTLSANGSKVPVGLDPQGKPVLANGTSFSTPQVTAAIALLQSIRPGLNASDIKDILVQTAHQQATIKETDSEGNPVERKVDVPQNLGGRILRIDEAVLQVINDLRKEKGLKPLDKEHLKAKSLVKLTATGGPDEYKLTATVAGVDEGGLTLSLTYSGQGLIAGNSKRQLSSSDSVSWDITLKDKNMFVKVTRSDSGACANINLSNIELEGTWEGFWVMTYSVFLDAQSKTQAKEASEECEEKFGEAIVKIIEEYMKLLLNKDVPLTLVFEKGSTEGSHNGSVHIQINQVIPQEEDEDDDESSGPTSFYGAKFSDGKLHFSVEKDGFVMNFIGQIDEYGDLIGTFNYIHEKGFDFISGTWRASKLNP